MSDPTNESDDEQHVNKENTTPSDMAMSPSNAKQSSTVPEVRESVIGTILKVGDVSFLLDQETLQKLNSDSLNQKIADAKAAAVVGAAAAAAASLDVGNGGPPKSSPRQQQQNQGGSNSSPQRRALLSNASEDASPSTTVVVVEGADAECFSALIHMARFGSLPTCIFNKDKRQLLLQQAESVWGIRPQVEEALDKARQEFRKSCDCVDAIHNCLMMIPLSSKPPVSGGGGTPGGCQKTPALAVSPAAAAITTRNRSSSTASSSSYGSSLPPGASAVCLGGPHHNFRRDDGSRRVFCSSCGHRDIDWRYHVGDYYANCDKCFKEVTYKPNLGWCHKCRQCDTCQTSECPGVPIRQLEEQVIPYMMTTLKNNQNELTFF